MILIIWWEQVHIQRHNLQVVELRYCKKLYKRRTKGLSLKKEVIYKLATTCKLGKTAFI
jgi:hypothetical protein